ncbi:hypothetical protein H6CHR_03193 [Variovorax sp. PBL-H6]|nr:hypothetical protein H6CHR_03193 [Variovorax sp. PBL-H6]
MDDLTLLQLWRKAVRLADQEEVRFYHHNLEYLRVLSRVQWN